MNTTVQVLVEELLRLLERAAGPQSPDYERGVVIADQVKELLNGDTAPSVRRDVIERAIAWMAHFD